MKYCKKLLLVGMIIIILASPIYAVITFERWYGGSDFDRALSVVQTSDGGYIITGWTFSFGPGLSDVYLIKTDSLGDTLWTKTYGGADIDGAFSGIQTSDGDYIFTGATKSYGTDSSDIYLIKTDSLGDTIWTRTYGGSDDDIGFSVIQISNDCYIIAGNTESFGAGLSDVYLFKTNSLGNTIWTKTFGDTAWEEAFSVVETFDGGYFITGFTESYGAGYRDVYLIKTDSLGDTVWTKTYGGTDSDWGLSGAQTSDGGYIVTGWTWSFGAGRADVYLIKTDSLGDTVWTRTHGDTDYDRGYSVAQTLDGGYIITGYKSISSIRDDVYLLKTDFLGDTIWTKTYGGSSIDWAFSVAQTSDGGYIIVGETKSFGAGSYDIYLIKTDSLGNVAGIKEAEEREEKREEGKQMTVYPNPFTTSTTITLSLPSTEHPDGIANAFHGTSRAESIELNIYDATGRLVKSVKLETSTYQLGTGLKAGIYFFKLNGKPVGKVVKVR